MCSPTPVSSVDKGSLTETRSWNEKRRAHQSGEEINNRKIIAVVLKICYIKKK